MVGARLPKGVKALHALPADQDVLKRVVESMPHVQRTVYVRRRNYDGKGGCTLFGTSSGLEGLRLFPGFVNPRLNAGRIVGLIQHQGHSMGE